MVGTTVPASMDEPWSLIWVVILYRSKSTLTPSATDCGWVYSDTRFCRKKPKVCLPGWRSARRRGVEVVQHTLPNAVDGAVGLIHDDQVERLRREGSVVGHGDRGVGDEVVQVRVGNLVPGQCPERPLDRGHDDLGTA
jgi:hypothetical protein